MPFGIQGRGACGISYTPAIIFLALDFFEALPTKFDTRLKSRCADVNHMARLK
jgi:hypothetical protein